MPVPARPRRQRTRLGQGRLITSHGYVSVWIGHGKPGANKNGFAYEHRLVAEQKIGRSLQLGEVVHHIDGDKQNNVPSNLEILSSIAEHALRHRHREDLRRPDEDNPVILCGCGCSERFAKFDASERPRRFFPGRAPRVVRASPSRDAVLALFATDPQKEVVASDVITLLDCSAVTAKAILGRAVDSGHLRRVRRGIYCLPLADAWRAEIRRRRTDRPAPGGVGMR